MGYALGGTRARLGVLFVLPVGLGLESRLLAGIRNPIRIVFELSKDFYWILPQNSLSIGNILVNA